MLLDLRAAEQERDLEVVLLCLARDLIVERRRVGPLVEAAGQAVELGVRGLVARVLAHRARERRERGVGVVAADLVQLGDLVEQLDLARRIEGVLRHDLVDADLLGPVAARLVDRLEDVRDRELVLGVADQPLEGVDRVAVLVLVLEDLAVRLDGRGQLVEVRLAQLREADQQRDLLVRLLDERELAAEVVAEVAPRAARRRRAGRGRAAPSGRRRLAEDLVVVAIASSGLVQHLLVDRGDAEQEVEPLVGLLRDVDATAIDLEQLGDTSRRA